MGSGGTILKWNGSTWSAQTSGTMNQLLGVRDSDASNVWAVGGNGTWLFSNDQSITLLPVELASFTARERSGVVELAWRTASELNNQGFYIERLSADKAGSSDGRDWQTLAFIPGHGTTQEE